MYWCLLCGIRSPTVVTRASRLAQNYSRNTYPVHALAYVPLYSCTDTIHQASTPPSRSKHTTARYPHNQPLVVCSPDFPLRFPLLISLPPRSRRTIPMSHPSPRTEEVTSSMTQPCTSLLRRPYSLSPRHSLRRQCTLRLSTPQPSMRVNPRARSCTTCPLPFRLG